MSQWEQSGRPQVQEPQPIKLSIREIITLILKAKGIRTGLWTLSVDMNLGATAMQAPDGKWPTAFTMIKGFGIVPVAENEPGNPNIVSAREATSNLVLPESVRDS